MKKIFCKNFLEESELSTDDIFWSKHDEDQQQQLQNALYPTLPKITSPPSQQQKTLTPSTPIQQIATTPTSIMKSSPSNIGTLRARAHNFISRNILIPETCCVVYRKTIFFFHKFYFIYFLLVS